MPNNGHAILLEHEQPIPQPNEPIRMRPRGKIIDPQGNTLRPREATTFMAKLDDRGSKEITVRQSTLWFVGTVLLMAGVLFSYGSSAIGWVRSDESQKMQIQQLQNDVNAIKTSVGDLKTLYEKEREARTVQEIQNAKALGYQLKAAESPEHGGKK